VSLSQPRRPFGLTGHRETILDLLLQLAAVGVLMYDVAPRNVLVSSEGAIKIIDFGRVERSSRLKHRRKWLRYAAKELLLPLSLVEDRVASLEWWSAAS
jgi:hypothetical protein